jgi:hypothetical protein
MPSGINVFYDIIFLYFLKGYWKWLEKNKKLKEEIKIIKEEKDTELPTREEEKHP